MRNVIQLIERQVNRTALYIYTVVQKFGVCIIVLFFLRIFLFSKDAFNLIQNDNKDIQIHAGLSIHHRISLPTKYIEQHN